MWKRSASAKGIASPSQGWDSPPARRASLTLSAAPRLYRRTAPETLIGARRGDDTILYTAGDDTLDLSQYAAAKVGFRVSGYDVLIDTPDGTLELDYQVCYDIGHERSNIESILFSDGALDETGIRQRAIDDQSTGGDDTVMGTNSDDVIAGGTGDDTLTGRNGAHTFDFELGDGQDIITDFALDLDQFRFIGTSLTFDDLEIEQSGNDATVSYSPTDVITLASIDATLLGADEFAFA